MGIGEVLAAASAKFSRRRISRTIATVLAISIFQVSGAFQVSPSFAASGSVGATTNSGTCASTVGETTYVTASFVNDAFCLLKFNTSTTWTVPTGVNAIEVLAVGGGGGGGSDGGGGGGGGEVRQGTGISVTTNNSAVVTVGAGGTGNIHGQSNGTNGGASSIIVNGTTVSAIGGLKSVNWQSEAYNAPGGSGGSGGTQLTGATDFSKGGRNSIQTPGYLTGFGTVGYAGVTTSFTGSSTTFAGGGGGGICTNTKSDPNFGGLAGGAGGGGRGALHTQNVGSDAGQQGTDGLGGGGGGGAACNDGGTDLVNARTAGGTGGKGVVYIKYVPAISLSSNPQSTIGSMGATVTFTATPFTALTGAGYSRSKKWQVLTLGGSWTDIAGATTDAYATPTLTRSMHLNQYRYVVTDTYGTAVSTTYSSAATLTVPAPLLLGDTDTALTALASPGVTYGNTTLAGAEELTPSSSDEFTVAAWIRPTNSCSSPRCTIIAREGVFRLTYYQNRISFVLWNGASYEWKDLNFASIPLNQWSHVAITRSGTTIKVYLNGNDIATYTMTYSPQTSNTSFFYVGNIVGASEPFKGSIDEVKIWKSNRGANIAADMNSNSTTSTGLVGYWSFNEGKDGIAYNQVLTRSAGTDMALYSTNYWDANVVSEASTSAAYTIRTFKRSYITAAGGWRAPSNVSQVHALVVGGGGAGGRGDSTAYEAGGGGGGGVLNTKSILTPQTVYSVTVGYGGVGEVNSPTNGGDSIAFSLTAYGGGYGAYATSAGGSGGSGGGGTHPSTNGGTGQAGQGFAGQKPSSNGWGGGGGGATGTPTDGRGGVGLTSNISGSDFVYGDGGGAGRYNGNSSLVGGSGNGGRGATAIDTGGSNGVTNSGGGGGGAYSSQTSYKGGNGGTGVVIVRWITAAKPIFTQPTIDTTTAGLTDTITVSANPISPLTRNYQWQTSSDTGTTWVNASTGSGLTSQTYTTPVLETSTSGARYQYRVIVTDSDTVGLFISDTSTAVYIVVNPRITFSGSYTSQKYGTSDSDTFTVANGTGNKNFTFFPGNRSGITWSSPSTNTAVVSVAPTVSVGTYVETITATDTKGAQTQFAVSLMVTKADTITVTTLARSDTYTGSVLNFIPSFTVVGLKNSDTATPISYNYAGADNAGTSYGVTSTKPMNAGTYSITPVTPSSLLDSYTAVTIETATLTINRAIRTITVTAPASPMKYGETRTVISSPSAGSGDGTITFATSTTDSCTVSSSTATAIKPSGTCLFSASISQGNNFLGATSSSGSTTLTKADTLTVQLRNPVEMVYTASAPATLPTITIVGLAYTDTATATRLYSAPASPVGAPQSYLALSNSSSVPVDVETYTVSSSINFTSGVSTNYVNIVYESSTVKITQATQPALTINLYGAVAGSSFLVVTNGGAGPGAVTESVTAGGSAINCVVANRSLSNSSPASELKTCNLLVTRAASRNYLVQSLSATVYFMPYVVSQPTQSTSGSGIGISGRTSLTIDVTTPPAISSLSTYSAARGSTIEINGSGLSANSLVVKFWRNQLGGTPVSVTDSKITIVIPSGATSGKVFVGTVNGETFSDQSLSITP